MNNGLQKKANGKNNNINNNKWNVLKITTMEKRRKTPLTAYSTLIMIIATVLPKIMMVQLAFLVFAQFLRRF